MSFWLIVGACVAWLMAFIAGYLLGYRKEFAPPQGSERDSMLQLLSELETWTHQYADDVSQHQDVLEALKDALTLALSGQANDSSQRERAVALFQDLLHSNSDLKQCLQSAERELDEKSRQIKCYLNEARTDGMTGLANRRAFDQMLETLFVAYRKGGKPFVLALIDVDRFKTINDSHGHPQGDRILKGLADILLEQIPNAILIARHGGDELAVLMEGPMLQVAEKLDDVRNRVQRSHADGACPITISVGISIPIDDMGAASVVRRADEALYAAKQMGRNRVYHHDGQEPTVVGAPQITQSA